jgi:hypothetical protein
MPSLQELRNDVRPGDTLYVVDAQGEETKGRLTNILDGAIMLDVDGTHRRFSIDSISQIDRTRRDSVKNGVLIDDRSVRRRVLGRNRWLDRRRGDPET